MASRNSTKTFFKDFSGGLNLYSDSEFTPVHLGINQLLNSQNAYWRGGLQKRRGMVKFNTNLVDAGSKVRALHRFYRQGLTPQLLTAAGDKIARYDEASSSWVNIKTGIATEQPVFFTSYGPTGKVFIANGLDTAMVWDGTSMSNYTIAPSMTKQFVIHRERVFAYVSGLDISYSDNLDPDTWSAATLTLASNDPVITACIKHAQNTADTSVVSQLLFFTDNTTWVLAGSDFVTLDDVVLHEVAGDIGTSSPKSVVRTPKGVIFFGRQQGRNNIFIVLGEGLGARIVPVGDAIRQELAKIPASALDDVVAVYHDGYYRLSVRPSGKISNTREWWLKMDGIRQENIAWYGPMERGVGMSSIIVRSGANDNNDLIGGGENGYVYRLDTGFNDDGASIDVEIETGFYDFGFASQEKCLEDIYVNAQASGGSATVSVDVDFGTTTSKTLAFTAIGGSFPYTFPFEFSRIVTNIKTLDLKADKPRGTYASLKIAFSEMNEDLLLNTLGIKYRVDEADKKEE